MSKPCLLLISFLTFATGPTLSTTMAQEESPEETKQTVDFIRQIRPILSDRCFSCHGPDESFREADLRLDVPDEVFVDRGGYAAVVPADLEASEVWLRIETTDDDLRMPPPSFGDALNAEEKELVRQWIEQGATWSAHWAYVPPRIVEPADSDSELHWIDAWIRQRLQERGLASSPEASRVDLIRRLSFDLTGLPPSPEEVAAFVADESPNAYEALVDRLLASEHFGERMAVYWLDLVRYADTVGYHGDQDHSISPYRDYVIDAFNRNLSFDRFTHEQLAGDLLADGGPEAQIATGYNRLLQTSHEGGVQPREYMAIYAADRVRNFSTVWMGATVGCAQCHTHKFDPYTIKDFYSLAAFFADIDEDKHFKVGSNSLPTKRPPELAVLSRAEREHVASIRQQIAEWQKAIEDNPDSPPEKVNELQSRIEEASSQVTAIEAGARLTMITVAIEPRTMRVLPRGNWLDESGEIVEPAIPTFLGKLNVEDRRPTRLDLARWLTDTENGNGNYTARVFANRMWYLMFGKGLSTDLIDFGGQGSPPLHPELLDRLALEFTANGWNVKALLKTMAMSKTYRQSSSTTDEQFNIDPQNLYFSRQSRHRLPAEFVRDNALAIGSLLVRRVGGPSTKPYQPPGYYQHLNFPTRKYEHATDESQWRRGVYVHWQRQFLHPMLQAFDAPRREECTAERPRSNTPLAAMVLLNDPSFVESAKAFAWRVLDEVDATDAAQEPHSRDLFNRRLKHAFAIAVARAPDEFEQALLFDFYQANLDEFSDNPDSADQLLSVGIFEVSDNSNRPELAAWTMMARVILNLSETMTRP